MLHTLLQVPVNPDKQDAQIASDKQETVAPA